jgi:hypothetical protein
MARWVLTFVLSAVVIAEESLAHLFDGLGWWWWLLCFGA